MGTNGNTGKSVGILLISTRKYKQFVQSIVEQINKYFLPFNDKLIFLFTDEFQETLESKSRVIQFMIPDFTYPYVTLFRYKMFASKEEVLLQCSHLIYLDVDMAIVTQMGKDFLVDEGLVAVRHPGFYANDGWGDSNNPKESASYLPVEKRRHYFCGGCQGGTAEAYLTASRIMSEGIEQDERNKVRAEWNDETFWNWYIHTRDVKVKEFSPSYCMIEQEYLRKAWRIDHLPVKIIALEKNHKEIRS